MYKLHSGLILVSLYFRMKGNLTNVLLLGANGGIARYAIDLFLNETDAQLTPMLEFIII